MRRCLGRRNECVVTLDLLADALALPAALGGDQGVRQCFAHGAADAHAPALAVAADRGLATGRSRGHRGRQGRRRREIDAQGG